MIEAMHANLGEQFTITDMARIAMFSKFHFSRVFQNATGLSPGRFLSALRLETAKQLLLSTSLSVADISIQVGYASVGTFSARFKSSVGVAPSTFRATGGFAARLAAQPGRRQGTGSTSVHGHVTSADPADQDLVFVGLFSDVIVEGAPIRYALLPRGGPFVLEHVPLGRWHVLAYSVGRRHPLDGYQDRMVGARGPIMIRPETGRVRADIRLRRAGPLDPPVLLAPLGERSDPAPLGAVGLRG
ncbi:MAG: helix-turn-helix transcriptional regulator [Streptosporangiaceae bacterium]